MAIICGTSTSETQICLNSQLELSFSSLHNEVNVQLFINHHSCNILVKGSSKHDSRSHLTQRCFWTSWIRQATACHTVMKEICKEWGDLWWVIIMCVLARKTGRIKSGCTSVAIYPSVKSDGDDPHHRWIKCDHCKLYWATFLESGRPSCEKMVWRSAVDRPQHHLSATELHPHLLPYLNPWPPWHSY
jgi:hypothetical protein